jgi:Flp pilus assembly protein TadD
MRRRRGWFALVTVSLVTACRGSAPLPPRALELNQGGIEALRAGELDIASTRFELALEYSPRFVEALTNQGLVELQRGNFVRARQLLERARRINPDVAQPHHGLGVLAERQLRPDLAAERYRDALEVDPGFTPSRDNLARLLFVAGHIEHARAEFARSVAVAPDDLHGLVGLVECLLRLGRIAEADATLDQAQLVHPEAPEVVVLLARRALRRERPDEAAELLTPLARGDADIAVTALGWLGVAELLRGRPRHAVGAGRRALEMSPEDSLATWVVAAGLHALNDRQAASWRDRAAAVSPP